jgi:hypothetical protein
MRLHFSRQRPARPVTSRRSQDEAVLEDFRTSSAKLFRRCPACGSSAVSSATHEPLGNSLHRWSACCEACRSWRIDVLTKRDTRQLLCWLASDRACIKEALERSRWTDPGRDLGELSRRRRTEVRMGENPQQPR